MIRRLCLVMALLVAFGACGKKKDDGLGESSPTTTAAPASADGSPPWPLGAHQADRIKEAGLPQLRAEGSLVHYHAHLDVYYEGESVLVPAGVGIDLDKGVISPLHTHQPTGIIHVEAEKDEQINLAQFLTEWGVSPKLPAKVYVNGAESPRGLGTIIRGNTEIALVFGTAPAEIPSTYDCTRSPSDACDQIPQP